jgi:glycosyltransferase involved in cell wall biosynthesis
MSERRPLLSIVTPAFNESANLPVLHARLVGSLSALDMDWEWVVVDDHSPDNTFAVISSLAAANPNIRAVRLARNSGSHAAVVCGLSESSGDCAVVMASDLQDPPETIALLLDKWRAGDQVVWAVRAAREGEDISTTTFSRAYYALMRHLIGIRSMAPSGADFFLLDRMVIDSLLRFDEANASLLALIAWMGFRQGTVSYTKEARLHGRSGWTFAKKLKLVIDSVASFSYLPIRVMSALGFVFAVLGLIYAAVVVINAMRGSPVQGWSSLMVVVLVIGGAQMIMMGILGEYLWRTLDQARSRPQFIIEARTGSGRENLQQALADARRSNA